MITLAGLNRLTADLFVDHPPTLPRILAAWARVDPDQDLARVLADTGLGLADMARAAEQFITIPASDDRELLVHCILKAEADPPATGGHLLQALCDRPEHRISKALVRNGANLEILRGRLEQEINGRKNRLEPQIYSTVTPDGTLLRFGRDLTGLGRQGAFGELCDRPAEIERMLNVLMRRRKCNVAVTGPAGIGKTALVELLARRLAQHKVPAVLYGTRLFEIGMGQLVAGTKYRGQFEKRFTNLLNALVAARPAILFIDEMHLLRGAGRGEGAPLDAANLLKPLLARTGIKVIGATTTTEYRRDIASDEALARRFQELRLEPPGDDLVFKMARAQTRCLETYHHLRIPDEILRQAIALTDRHQVNRYQPDKSIDLLDSSAVLAKRENRAALGAGDLRRMLASQTGRPLLDLTAEGRKRLVTLEQRLKRTVIGQNTAISKVTATLIQRCQDLGQTGCSLGTFLFSGPTGVGKSELARCLADELFNGRDWLLHLDLAEYSRSGSVQKLVGAPPGYAGCDRDGVMTGWLQQHGSGVLLFDEIEKAHPDIHRLLLGLLDEGRIRSGMGRRLDTRQCVVILTTNVAAAHRLNRPPIGFAVPGAKPELNDLLGDHFPREFLGRLDELILFNPLGAEQLQQVLKLHLEKIRARLCKKGIRLAYDETRLMTYFLAKVQTMRSGARDISRLLDIRLLQPLARTLLHHPAGGPVKVILGESFYRKGAMSLIPAPQSKTDTKGGLHAILPV